MPDTLLLLEHEGVYTAGRRTQPRTGRSTASGHRCRSRGRITWHGPGQLVGYPIIRLAEPLDVVGYVRRLEELLITTCAAFGVHGERVAGRSGVWVVGPPTARSPRSEFGLPAG